MTKSDPTTEAQVQSNGHGNGTPKESSKRIFVQLMKMTAPLILQQLSIYIIGPVAVMFCGHLGTLELDAVALANSFGNVFGLSVGVGFGAACDTLFSQVYGTGNKRKMGVVLQRAILIHILVFLISFSLLINGEALCNLLGQDPETSRLAGLYMLILVPGMAFFHASLVVIKFLQNQGYIIPTLVIGFVANVGNVIFHYLFIYVADYSIFGSALASSLSYFIMFLLSIMYVFWSGLLKDTWGGWSRQCLEDWWQFTVLGLGGLFMICLEWWSFEAGIILAGLLGTVELAAQSLVFQVEIICYMLPLGNGIATSILVGQYLGASQPQEAKTTSRIGLTVIGITGLTVAVLLASLATVLPRLFTEDPAVQQMASNVFYAMGAYMLFDCLAGTCGGILRGSGRQVFGAVVVMVTYIIGLCIAVPLMFLTDLGIIGFWIGLMVALFALASVYCTYILRLDWDKEVEKAHKRVGEKVSDETERTPLFPKKKTLAKKGIIIRPVIAYTVFLIIAITAVCVRLILTDQGGPFVMREPIESTLPTTTNISSTTAAAVNATFSMLSLL